jgi:nucleoside-diphosphate-sugar epimerase
MDRLKILITGGNGYIAKSIHSALCEKHDITLVSRTDLDMTRREEVQHYFKDKYFDMVIHTAVKGGSRLNPLEGPDVVLANLLMYDNLIRCRDKFNRLIHFGSGAEDAADSPYGFSKHLINQLMKLDPKSVNTKIYAVFDENELATRFIKGNILRYINKEDIVIHQDKKMDFFYMKDLVALVEWLINQREEEFPIQEINCSYIEKSTLVQIAKIINSLDDHKVNIVIENEGQDVDYCDVHPIMPFNLIGLEQGIKEVYNILKQQK